MTRSKLQILHKFRSYLQYRMFFDYRLKMCVECAIKAHNIAHKIDYQKLTDSGDNLDTMSWSRKVKRSWLLITDTRRPTSRTTISAGVYSRWFKGAVLELVGVWPFPFGQKKNDFYRECIWIRLGVWMGTGRILSWIKCMRHIPIFANNYY